MNLSNLSNLSINTIVVPQGAEYQAVRRGLKLADAQDIKVVSIPIGTKDVLQTLINRSFEFTTPQGVLIMGLCGGLTNEDRLGKALLYQNCHSLKQEKLALDSKLTAVVQHKLKDKSAVDLISGLTSDRPICHTAEKARLGQKYAARAIDMEGFGYIKELQRQGMKVGMLRIVSDDLSGDIPDLSLAIDQDGNLKSLPLAIAMLQKPLAAARLIRGSWVGLKVLQEATTKLFAPG